MAVPVELVIKTIDESGPGIDSATAGLDALGDKAEELNKHLEELYKKGVAADLAMDEMGANTAKTGEEVQGASDSIRELNEIMTADVAILKQASEAGVSFGDTLKLIRGDAQLVDGELRNLEAGTERTAEATKEAEAETKKWNKALLQIAKGAIGTASLYFATRKVADMVGEWAERMREAFIAEARLADKTGELAAKEKELIAVQQKVNALQGAKIFGDYAGSVEKLTLIYKQSIIQTQLTKEKQKELNLEYKFSGEVVSTITGNVVSYDTVLNRLGITFEDVGKKASRSIQWMADNWSEFELRVNRRFAKGALGARYWTDLGEGIGDATEEAEDFTDELSEAERKARDIKFQIGSFWDDIDRGISGTILDQINDIEFVLAGGDALQRISDLINAALRGGALSKEDAKALLQNLEIEAVALDIQLGEITQEEGANIIAELLGITPEAAGQLLTDVISGAIDLIDENTVKSAIAGKFEDPLTGAFNEILLGSGGMRGGVIDDLTAILNEGVNPMRERLNEIIEQFQTLGGFPKVTITIETEGGGEGTMP